MKVLVVGCGSIGTRRAKILADMGHEVWGCDPKWDYVSFDEERSESNFDAAKEWTKATGAKGFFGELTIAMAVMDDSYDAAMICTPPDSGRAEQIRETAPNVKGLFVEKPLALNARDLGAIKARWVAEPLVTMGACNLRFSEGVDALRKIDDRRCGYFHMGMHRKYWNKDHQPISMILDSIHELDLAVWAMGPVISISGESTEDKAKISVHHDHGYSTIYLDRLSDPPIREASVYPPDGLSMDGSPHIHINTDPSMYVREMQHFMDCVEAGVPTCNPIEDAADVCRWALEVA